MGKCGLRETPPPTHKHTRVAMNTVLAHENRDGVSEAITWACRVPR